MDGLRGSAIIPVMPFHIGFPSFAGGWALYAEGSRFKEATGAPKYVARIFAGVF